MNKVSQKEDEKRVEVKNDNLKLLEYDHLHHFGISSNCKHFNGIFSDIKFVVTGGSAKRMWSMARKLMKDLDLAHKAGNTLDNICKETDRFVMYKAGPVLLVNHGMGVGSIMIMLHEVIKAMYYSKASGVSMFRVGTSGGIGLDPGSVVLTTEALDSAFRYYLEVPMLGKVVRKSCELCGSLRGELLGCVEAGDGFEVVEGKTICSWDFYEGQARLDGAVCGYSDKEKLAFLNTAHALGVRNFEMESQAVAYLCKEAGVKAAVVCVTYLNRLLKDQVTADHETLTRWQERPMMLVTRLIKKHME